MIVQAPRETVKTSAANCPDRPTSCGVTPAQFLGAIIGPGRLASFRPMTTWQDEEGRKQSRILHSFRAWIEVGGKGWERQLHRQIGAARIIGSNVSFGVCPRSEPGADRAEEIELVSNLWVDLDGCPPVKAIERIESAGLPPPSVVVSSGHGTHCYWILEEAERVTTTSRQAFVEGLVRNIGRAIGGDTVSDLSRLLRLPGTINFKNARNGQKPVPCEVVGWNPERRYSLEDFGHWTPTPQELESRARRGRASGTPPAIGSDPIFRRPIDTLSERQQQRLDSLILRSATAPRGERSGLDFGLLLWAVRKKLDPGEVWQRVQRCGKFAEAGPRYFNRSWGNAVLKVGPDVDPDDAQDAGNANQKAAGECQDGQERAGNSPLEKAGRVSRPAIPRYSGFACPRRGVLFKHKSGNCLSQRSDYFPCRSRSCPACRLVWEERNSLWFSAMLRNAPRLYVSTIRRKDWPRYYKRLKALERKTGVKADWVAIEVEAGELELFSTVPCAENSTEIDAEQATIAWKGAVPLARLVKRPILCCPAWRIQDEEQEDKGKSEDWVMVGRAKNADLKTFAKMLRELRDAGKVDVGSMMSFTSAKTPDAVAASVRWDWSPETDPAEALDWLRGLVSTDWDVEAAGVGNVRMRFAKRSKPMTEDWDNRLDDEEPVVDGKSRAVAD